MDANGGLCGDWRRAGGCASVDAASRYQTAKDLERSRRKTRPGHVGLRQRRRCRAQRPELVYCSCDRRRGCFCVQWRFAGCCT
jgi:hypothetical protein